MARAYYHITDPELMAYVDVVDEIACRGPRKAYVMKEATWRVQQEETRLLTLHRWENANPLLKVPGE